MAGFHTHITVSTAVGVGYAYLGHTYFQLPLSTCAIAGGLCSICGFMPDLDSDHAVPARETLSFLAAVAPMLLFYRFHFEGLPIENILLFGAPLYVLIRFGFGQMLKVSVHRGMFHSIPAAAIAGLIAYVICDTGVSFGRTFKGIGATIGYLTHLILDEIWAVEMTGGHLRLKKSFGTAMKLFGKSAPANSSTWGLLIGLCVFAANDLGHPEIVAPFQRTRPGQLTRTQSTRAILTPTKSLRPDLAPGLLVPKQPLPDRRHSSVQDEGWR